MVKKPITMFFMLSLVTLLSVPCLLYAQTSAGSDSPAKDALQRLEVALSGGNAAENQSASRKSGSPVMVTHGGKQPRWVNDPYLDYNRNRFIAAVGSAANRNQAEAKALANLVSIFGQSVQSDFTVTTMYTEAVNRGVVSVSDNTSVRDRITTAASMDNIIGAEIGNIWDSGHGIVYAAAYMDKAKTVSIYTDMIIINNNIIEMLTAMTSDEKNTFDGYARYKLAGQIAGINANYAVVVSQAGGSTSSLNIKSADSFIIEAAGIMRNITVAVTVTNDRANRVQNAFASVLNSEGLRTKGNNPVYSLEVNLDVNEAAFPDNVFVFCRMEANANLIENLTGASLLPFSFNLRDGHATYKNAEASVFTGAERIIAEKYPAVLREYIASLNVFQKFH